MKYFYILVTLDSISKTYKVWSMSRDLAEQFAIAKFRAELASWGFQITKHDGQIVARIARETTKGQFFNLPSYYNSQEALGWLLTLPGWLRGDTEYRSQSWLPLPDKRVLRVMSGEEPGEPDLITDIYDPRGTIWEI